MKKNYIAVAALLSTAFTPTPAFATPATPNVTQNADPSPVTASDMKAYCDGQYVSDPSLQRTSVTGDSATADASTPTADTQNFNYRPDTSSSFVYAQFLYATDPLTRTGGSVNMWGQSVFGQKIWDNTLYDTKTRFEHNVRYNWTCHVDHWEIVGSHEETTPAVGEYVWDGIHGHGNDCDAHNAHHPSWWGIEATHDNCVFVGTLATTTTVDDYDWVSFGDFAAVEVTHGPIDDGYYTTDTDLQQLGHVEGVNYTETGLFTPQGVRTLACINPGKKGGIWTKKNGYTGVNCNTTYFNTAQTAYGFTFDTVSGQLPSASLPAQ